MPRICLCILLLLLLPLCGKEVQVRILQTSDLHGNLLGDGISPTTVLQLASVVRQASAEAEGGRAILIDTGDTIQGSLASRLSNGEAMAVFVAVLGYDAWIPGNHDFDFGGDVFLRTALALRKIVLCGNLSPASARPGYYPAWRIFERNGARVAVIGVTASYLPHWFLGFEKDFRVEPAAETIARVLPEVLEAKPDAIVLAAHQGWLEKDLRDVNEIRSIAKRFPEIDLVLGAHTHRAFPGRSIGPSTWYVQPGAHGEFVAQVDMRIDTEAHKVIEHASRLLKVPAETPVDQRVAAALAPYLAKAMTEAAEAVSPPLAAAIPAGGRPGVSCPMSELFCKAIADATKCDAVIHGTLSRVGLAAGEEVTRGRLFEVVPYENTIVTCLVTAEELAQIVSEQWEQRKSSAYCGLWGAVAEFHGKDAVIVSIGRNLSPPVEGKRYKLAMNSHTAAGSGRFNVLTRILSQAECQTTDTGISTREAVARWLQSHPGETVEPRVWMRAAGKTSR